MNTVMADIMAQGNTDTGSITMMAIGTAVIGTTDDESSRTAASEQ